MRKARVGVGLLASLLLWSNVALAAKPTPAEILRFRPAQEGVVYTTPAAVEVERCQVELVTDGKTGSGWLLRDPQGRALRRFFDTDGDRKADVWSYYLDGVEVYREIDTQKSGRPDHFRWLNAGGMKYGIDLNKDGKIDAWRMISAEEASQEVLAAVLTKDFARLQALFISDSDITYLGLPQSEVARIQQQMQGAAAKFQATLAKLGNLNEKTRWIHLEAGVPACIPADVLGSKNDLIKYPRASLLCQTGDKHDWLHIGEMIRVGQAWRITDAPSMGEFVEGDTQAAAQDPALQGLLNQLRLHDAQAPQTSEGTAAKEVVAYNLARADLLEQIVAKVKPEEREQWIRQIADCLSAAAQNGGEVDSVGYQRLMRLEQQIVAAVPNTPLAAYVTFRELSADNSVRLIKAGPDVSKIQEQAIIKLTKFVETYQNAEDTPEALMQLGMVCEFVLKDEQAKKWYGILAKNFPDHPAAAKARGAERRLDSEGKVLELAGPVLGGGNFDIASLRGKVVLVYYWASRNRERCVGDFATLKLLQETYGPKGFALVCVSLDPNAQEATNFVQRLGAPGIHLFAPGGSESPLATQYGVMVLPQLFFVDKEGKVISRTLQQVTGLEEELKKRLSQ